jgi:hypothetical protein
MNEQLIKFVNSTSEKNSSNKKSCVSSVCSEFYDNVHIKIDHSETNVDEIDDVADDLSSISDDEQEIQKEDIPSYLKIASNNARIKELPRDSGRGKEQRIKDAVQETSSKLLCYQIKIEQTLGLNTEVIY